MTTRSLGGWWLLACSLCCGCGGGDERTLTVEPLPAGAGTYFTSDFLGGDAAFYRVDGYSGETQQQAPADIDRAVAGTLPCPPLAALDSRADGSVLAAAKRSAALFEADVRQGLCRPFATAPETMVALAVRADGRVITVSASNTLHQFDAQGRALAALPLRCPAGVVQCPVRGIDFAPDGTLYAIAAPGLWSRLDTATGQLTAVRSGVGLSDDFDIDAQGKVRGLAGDELRGFDLSGAASGRAVNVFGGTAFATGVVHR